MGTAKAKPEILKKRLARGNIQGLTLVITGGFNIFERNALKKKLHELGATVCYAVTTKTDAILTSKSTDDVTSNVKISTAKALGIAVIQVDVGDIPGVAAMAEADMDAALYVGGKHKVGNEGAPDALTVCANDLADAALLYRVPLADLLTLVETALVGKALIATRGNQSQASKILKVNRGTLGKIVNQPNNRRFYSK